MSFMTLGFMTLLDVLDTEHGPYVVEGHGASASRIYFESEESKEEYLCMEMHGSENISGLKNMVDVMENSTASSYIS